MSEFNVEHDMLTLPRYHINIFFCGLTLEAAIVDALTNVPVIGIL